MVAPVSFRDPRIAAWQAAAIHGLAPGRLRFGLGAGWMEREHEEWGFDLLGLDARFQRFTEALEIVTRLLRKEGPVSFSGEFYELDGAELVPNPVSQGALPIVIGGNGRRRTLPLAARFADEWNGVYLSADGFRERSRLLDDLLREQGRQPGEVRRTSDDAGHLRSRTMTSLPSAWRARAPTSFAPRARSSVPPSRSRHSSASWKLPACRA